MIKRFCIVLFILCLPVFSIADTHTADDCTYEKVNAAVTAAHAGDTVAIPACAETTWTSTLTITVPIILQGNGVGSTNIKSSAAVAGITYTPVTPHPDNRFRITGFSLTYTGTGNYPIKLSNGSTTKEYIRIDHNIISTTQSAYVIGASGTIFGVIDNNTITPYRKAFDFSGNGSTSSPYNTQWNAFYNLREYGTIDNLYVEDNVVSGGNDAINVAGGGGRFSFRYNALATTTIGAFDMHGNQPTQRCIEDNGCGNASTMISEIYGNIITRPSGYFSRLADIRGGWTIMFNNSVMATGASAMYVREEYADDQWPVNAGWTQKVSNTYVWRNWINNSSSIVPLSIDSDENCCSAAASAWQSGTIYDVGHGDIYCQKFTGDVSGSCWKQSVYGVTPSLPYSTGEEEPTWSSTAVRYNTAKDGDIYWLNMGTGSPLTENIDFWHDAESFNGSVGVGCGTAATMNAIESCTEGVGFWVPNATIDPTAASCTDISDYVGVTNAKAVSVKGNTGKLYKCNGSNEWVEYYTPYTYPHPFRGEGAFYVVTPSVTGGGALSPSYAESVASGGDSATYTATTHPGWKIKSWGGACSGAGATCQVTNITENKSVEVEFDSIKLLN